MPQKMDIKVEVQTTWAQKIYLKIIYCALLTASNLRMMSHEKAADLYSQQLKKFYEWRVGSGEWRKFT